jgi:sterol desaturase/sphingolipid hydroxylase (fatty acid hydroxylase superfamily)
MAVVGAELDRGPGRAGTGARRLNALNPGSLGVAALTVWVVAVAARTLEVHGQLGTVLVAGWSELVAPVLVVLVVATVVWERARPHEPRPVGGRGRAQDLCFAVLHAGMVVPLMTLLSVGFATLVSQHASWLTPRWTAGWPDWLLLPLAIVAMDGANWVAHYADHRLGTLWRFHRLHHSQEELSVLTTFRAHPLMHTTGFLLATIPVVALLGHRPMVPALITAYVCTGTLQHANVRWTFGPVGRVVVSPTYHRLHHSVDDTAGVNLGVVFTVWDVLAGRARFPAPGEAPCPTGLAGRPLAVEQAPGSRRHLRLLAMQLLDPFLARHGG